MAIQQDIVSRITNVHWPVGKWLVIDMEMMSSQGGGDSQLTFDVKNLSESRTFDVKADEFVQKRFPKKDTALTIKLPKPGPPVQFVSDPLKKLTAFNYDTLTRIMTIIPGMGGVNHRNVGIQYSNVMMFDLGLLRKTMAPVVSENQGQKSYGDIKIKFEPKMNFTTYETGGGSSPEIWIIPIYVYEDGNPFKLKYVDTATLNFPTYQEGVDWVNNEILKLGGFVNNDYTINRNLYPHTASLADVHDFGIYKVGGDQPAEKYGDIYTVRIKLRTYKSLKKYYLEKNTISGDPDNSGSEYEEVQSSGKLADLYEYRVSLYLEPYYGVVRRLIRNNTTMSSIDMELPKDITITIDNDLMITGPESPDDDPDEDGEEGPR